MSVCEEDGEVANAQRNSTGCKLWCKERDLQSSEGKLGVSSVYLQHAMKTHQRKNFQYLYFNQCAPHEARRRTCLP